MCASFIFWLCHSLTLYLFSPKKKKKLEKKKTWLFSVPIILQVQLLSPGNFTQHLASAVSPC